MPNFTHLRVHTHLSFMQAICRTEDLIEKTKKDGGTALAKTEFDNLCGAPSFVKDCKDAGIKPILGTDFSVYIDDDTFHRVTVIATTKTGYKSLVRLNTLAWEANRKKKFIYARELNLPDIFLLVSPPHGLTYQRYVAVYTELTKHNSNVYLEATNHFRQDDRSTLELVNMLSGASQRPVVATNDVLFTNQDDWSAHQSARKIGNHPPINDGYPEYYLKTQNEMTQLGLDPQWLKNAQTLADLVEDYKLVNKGFIIPTFKDESGEWSNEDARKKLEQDAFMGLYNKNLLKMPGYTERLKYELEVMKEKNFSSYFLIIADIIRYMKASGYLPPYGRGSSVGSLVCYALDIIAMDPIKWDVLFERFINSGRKDLPDIDTDITQRGRQDVLGYIARTHGADRVAHIATYQTMAVKAAIDNVCRARGIPNAVSKDLREQLGDFAESFDDVPKSIIDVMNNTGPEWLAESKALFNTAKNMSYHAAGIVIHNEPLHELVPIIPHGKDTSLIGIQYDMRDCEILGLLKLDMLGLKNIDIIQDTLNMVRENYKDDINIFELEPDDPGAYALISTGDYVSLFQLDSPGYRSLCRQLKPANFDHLMALNALYRPGPMESGVTKDYIKRRHNLEPAYSWHPWLDEVLKGTYQTVLYQEEAMAMSKIIAGFTEVEADEFRKGIGKKNEEAVKASLKKFRDGALKRPGLTPPPGYEGNLEQWVDELIKKLEGYARYMWNKGHSCGYGMVTYTTAYLEAYYPHPYYVSLLNSNTDKPKRIPILVRQIQSRGYEVKPPDINYSGREFSMGSDNRNIYMGLDAIKNVSDKDVTNIIEERKNGPYTSFIEFCQRLPGVNKKAKENLVYAGAFTFDKMITDRDKVENAQIIIDITRKKTKKFDGSKIPISEVMSQLALGGGEYNDLQRQQNERNVLNSYVTGHPAEIYVDLKDHFYLRSENAVVVSPSEVPTVEEKQTMLLIGVVDSVNKKYVKVKPGSTNSGKEYLTFTLSDRTDVTFITIWPNSYDPNMFIKAGSLLMVQCSHYTSRTTGYKNINFSGFVNLDNGVPIAGVACFGDHDPTQILKDLSIASSGVMTLGGNERFAAVKNGSITLKPDVILDIVKKYDGDAKFLIAMG